MLHTIVFTGYPLETNAAEQVLSEKEADIYAQVNASELILALSKKGCNVQSMQERDESLESYYISLVGGQDGCT